MFLIWGLYSADICLPSCLLPLVALSDPTAIFCCLSMVSMNYLLAKDTSLLMAKPDSLCLASPSDTNKKCSK